MNYSPLFVTMAKRTKMFVSPNTLLWPNEQKCSFLGVVTSMQFLRLFSVLDTQREVLSTLDTRPVLAMAGHEERLIICYHNAPPGGRQQHLAELLVQTKGLQLRVQHIPLPLLAGHQLTWLCFSDCGSPVFNDNFGLLQLYSLKSGCWYPVCDSMKQSQSVSNNYFVIAVSERSQIVQAVLCRGSTYPMTDPRPMMQELHMQLPLCDAEAQKSELEDALMRSAILSTEGGEKQLKETAETTKTQQMISPRKSTSVCSVTPPEQHCKMLPISTKSCESLYSNTSSSKGSATILYRRKTPPMRGVIGSRQATLIPANSEVRQRVLSARRLRMKTYQNQLADAQQTIAELAHENRILRTLHKRQDSALAKYESTNAELPQLLHSHAEELRVWQAKHRNLQAINKDLEQKLKQKEIIILSLTDQNKYFSQLNKDKNLEERQRLTDKLVVLETRLQEKDNDIKLMARKVQLETKNFKQQLQYEQKRTKDIMIKLEKARMELSGYRKLDELNLTEKFSNIALRRAQNCNIDENPKVKNVNKVTIKTIYNKRTTADNTDNQEREHFSNSNTISNLDINSTRTIHKMLPPTTQQSQAPEPIPARAFCNRNDDGTESLHNLNAFSAANKPQDFTKSKNKCHEFENYVEIISVDDERDEALSVHLNDEAVVALDHDAESLEDDEEIKDSNQAVISTDTSSRIKEEIRQQISDDYKEREAFLDTFCRQATSSALREESPQKQNTISLANNMPKVRKHKLLAALKAIDDKS